MYCLEALFEGLSDNIYWQNGRMSFNELAFLSVISFLFLGDGLSGPLQAPPAILIQLDIGSVQESKNAALLQGIAL